MIKINTNNMNKLIYYEIIKKDLSLANPLLRSCKKINKWIYDNKSLMKHIALYYQSKIENRINFELHRFINFPFNDTTDTFTDLWVDGVKYSSKPEFTLSFNLKDIGGARVTNIPSFKLSQEELSNRLQNPSNIDAALIIKLQSQLYNDAEKYANVEGKHNGMIDLLDNFKNMLIIFNFQEKSHLSIVEQKIDTNLNTDTDLNTPSLLLPASNSQNFYEQNKLNIVFVIGFLIGIIMLYYNLVHYENIKRITIYFGYFFTVIFGVFGIWSLIDESIIDTNQYKMLRYTQTK